MQYTLDGENGDRSSDAEDGLSSNPLAHPFSNTLYNYGQHTSLPQPWQEASGLAITYPVYNGTGGDSMALQGDGGNRTSSGLYTHEDVLEREIALLEEEDPTSFLDGLVEPTVDEEQVNDQSNPKSITSAPSKWATTNECESKSYTSPYPQQQPNPESNANPRPKSPATTIKLMDLAERGTAANAAGSSENQEPHEEQDEFKTFGLPLARIKKVMKSDPEVKVIFIAELTCRAWLVAESHKRRTLQKSDVASAIGFSDMFDFLIDIVPREEAISKSELGMKRRTARMKEKKEEEKKRKRQEELEDAFAHSQGQGQAQARSQIPQGSRAATEVGYSQAQQGQILRPNQGGSAGTVAPSMQQHRPIMNAQRGEEDMPPEKRRRED
ncbi:hypothetical protein QFC22_002166 [Naganishia vaughanmartiniae]|uniref:Uncharacterized protein n=1 Tax=Naganishia vaughanmartiniae TaxID=1424756 RepID=A0ACC2XFR0_9TREE|nr:hypothetical protein QFC22_002166 [Naganishia vaughanmartiniae]